jgi:two-component system cell cycle sensor histidine kinase/response regulator CckA
VVEDEATTREALVKSLKALKYRTLEATNGERALEIFEQHADAIDLVLSDVVMPEMGGKALLYALQERNPAVRVVLLTGHPLDEQEFENLHTLGLRRCILKPLSLEQLARVVTEALSPVSH